MSKTPSLLSACYLFFDCVVSILQIEKMGLRDAMHKVFKMAQCAAEELD